MIVIEIGSPRSFENVSTASPAHSLEGFMQTALMGHWEIWAFKTIGAPTYLCDLGLQFSHL